MPTHRCETCQIAQEPGYVSVTFVGARRPLTIRLNQVPAMVCPRCRAPRVTPELARHLNELGATVTEVLGEVRTRPAVERRGKPERAA